MLSKKNSDSSHKRTAFQRPDRIEKPLDVIVTVFNSARFRSRWKHYEDFATVCEAAGAAVRLWTVEVAFGARASAIAVRKHGRHLLLRTNTEIWHKERSQNLLIQRVLAAHPDAEYFALVDADLSFSRHDWADETRHALQHYDVVQMWEECYDLNASGSVIQQHRSFAACYLDGRPIPKNGHLPCYGYGKGKRVYFHPGYAWAWRKRALDQVGGLIDWAILGSADFHMAYGLIDRVGVTLKPGLGNRYAGMMRDWQRRARGMNANVGVVSGSILHHWHGPKADRQYQSRWKILEKTKFDPVTDLTPDAQGLYRLNDRGDLRSRELRDLTRRYFHRRNEDQL